MSKIAVRVTALLLGLFVAVAAAAVSVTLVVESVKLMESIKPKAAPVRAVPVEPEAEKFQAPAPLSSSSTSPRRRPRSRVIRQVPPTTMQEPERREPVPSTVNREHRAGELQAP
jgi:hypothetical protein